MEPADRAGFVLDVIARGIEMTDLWLACEVE